MEMVAELEGREKRVDSHGPVEFLCGESMWRGRNREGEEKLAGELVDRHGGSREGGNGETTVRRGWTWRGDRRERRCRETWRGSGGTRSSRRSRGERSRRIPAIAGCLRERTKGHLMVW